ncbi:MAG: fructosamine kinase family protein [Thiomargarita sp.]|nr:fructosamine kinase family protein [Thiomargarita sp.]
MSLDWNLIAQHISSVIGEDFKIQKKYSISGGCINQAYCIEDMQRRFFIKLNDAQYEDMFLAEQAGLNELNQAHAIRVPKPLCTGLVANKSYLVIEYLDLQGSNQTAISELGEQLALLHQKTASQFGWQRNNYIGSTAQINTLEDDWVTFWQQHRLKFQLDLATKQGYLTKKVQQTGAELIKNVGLFFTDYQPQASLLHGDLWSGNYSIITSDNQPVIYDPAIYYGDREVDIAMTELFGGFSQHFYAAYQAILPLDSGYSRRKILYNLYHILNHLNLFGGSYIAQAENMIDSLLSEF